MDVKIKKRTKFFKYLIYYICRFISEKNIKIYTPLAGFSFDSIHHHINIFGTYEFDELEVLKKFIKKNIKNPAVALDIGANLGNHTVRLFSKIFTRVHCFEPNSKIYKLLELNVEGLHNITLHRYGLSNKTGKYFFKIDPTNLGGSKIINSSTNFDNNQKMQLSKIAVKKLDSLVNMYAYKINLMKIDVEGHELKVLLGARKIIEKNSPIILIEESNINKNGTSKTLKHLKKLNYSFYIIKENFYFGDSVISRLAKYLFQDIFGNVAKIVKIEKFERKFYHFIICIRKNNN
jgi:FkbM family methyltransferase